MRIFKKWIREFLSLFVFLRFKNIWNLYYYLFNNNKKTGICASVFTHYCDSHSSYIGIGAKFNGTPYLPHGLNGIFISDNAQIGKNCVIFQQVTIGSNMIINSQNQGSPTIGDNCYIGAGAKIIGNISIGNNCRIGANAVVYEDVPDNSVIVMSKTRIIQKDNTLDNRFIKNVDGKLFYYNFESENFELLK